MRFWGCKQHTLNQGNHQVERPGIKDFFGLIPSNGLVDHPLKLLQINSREILEKNRFIKIRQYFRLKFKNVLLHSRKSLWRTEFLSDSMGSPLFEKPWTLAIS